MEKYMETIKVYESYWKSDTDLAWSLTICIWAVYAILKSGYEYSGMILLGMFGFFVVINSLKRIWRKPRLIVYDSAVKVNTSEPWSVLFNDVESFYPTRYNGRSSTVGSLASDTRRTFIQANRMRSTPMVWR